MDHCELILNNMPDHGVIAMDETGIITDWNPGAERIFGYSKREILGRSAVRLRPFEARREADFRREMLSSQLAMANEGDGWHERKDGTRFWASGGIYPMLDEADRRVGFVKVVRDVDENSRRAEVFVENEEQLELVMSSSTDFAVFLMDTEGKIIHWGPSSQKLFGYSSEEALGNEISLLLPTEEIPALELQKHESRVGAKGFAAEEGWHLRKDGSRFWGSGTLSRLQDKTGRFRGYVKIIRDLTLQWQAETALKESEEKFRLILEAAGTAIFGTDLSGNCIFVNPACVNQLEFQHGKDLLGKNIHGLIHPIKADGMPCLGVDSNCALLLPLRDGKERYAESEILWKADGAPFSAECRSFPIWKEGRIAGCVVTFRDVTEKRSQEKIRQKDAFRDWEAGKSESIGRLAGGLAHELNNALTPIIGYSDLLLARFPVESGLKQWLLEIKGSGERATALIQQMLAYGSRQTLDMKDLDINAFLEKTAQMLDRVKDGNVQVITMPRASHGRVEVDPAQLEKVVLNLFLNARDAMPSGGQFTMETSDVDLRDPAMASQLSLAPGTYALLAISDTGMGMDTEMKRSIFEPFYSSKPLGSEVNGMGLSAAYGIIRQSGGNILVYSELGKGSIFKIYLPEAAREDTADAARSQTELNGMPQGGETLLVVENDPYTMQQIREALRAKQYKTLEAGSGREARIIFERRRGPIHMLITDVMLQDVAGPDLFREFGLKRPDLKSLFLSTYTAYAVVRQGLLTSEADFLQKPFSSLQLLKAVRKALDGDPQAIISGLRESQKGVSD
jgi:two-component system cell cycle sensor histidine kinase/response regulator CckA